MSKMNRLGLNAAKSNQLSDKLNQLLSNYQLFYQNARGFHWNIRGEKFFELHVKFEELYTDALVKIDEIAERILTLEGTPVHAFSDYIANSEIKEHRNISEGKKAVKEVVNGIQVLIILEREILKFASDAGDEGTNALMSDYIREQEKTVWMYSAFMAH